MEIFLCKPSLLPSSSPGDKCAEHDPAAQLSRTHNRWRLIWSFSSHYHLKTSSPPLLLSSCPTSPTSHLNLFSAAALGHWRQIGPRQLSWRSRISQDQFKARPALLIEFLFKITPSLSLSKSSQRSIWSFEKSQGISCIGYLYTFRTKYKDIYTSYMNSSSLVRPTTFLNRKTCSNSDLYSSTEAKLLLFRDKNFASIIDYFS